MSWAITSKLPSLALAWMCLALAACAAPQSGPLTARRTTVPPPPVELEAPPPAPPQPNPRVLAALRLTDQARILLDTGRVDDAINLLERAVGLHPANGQNYYYLAEAWMVKGNWTQAETFNRLAEIHLKEDTGWPEKVRQQRVRIERRRK